MVQTLSSRTDLILSLWCRVSSLVPARGRCVYTVCKFCQKLGESPSETFQMMKQVKP